MADLGGSVEVAGKAVGLGASVAAALAFIKWLFEYVGKRLDIRSARLDAQELLVGQALIDRLKKLEMRVARLDRATTILIAEVRGTNPTSPKLAEVHRILDETIPLEPDLPDDMREQLGRMQ
jgi:hypothetical protein